MKERFYCSGCHCFEEEDMEGFGYCVKEMMIRACDDDACHGYVAREEV